MSLRIKLLFVVAGIGVAFVLYRQYQMWKRAHGGVLVPVSKERCLLIARTLMNPLGLENDAVLHSVHRNDWPKGCIVDTNISKVFWNRTRGIGGHGDGGHSVQ